MEERQEREARTEQQITVREVTHLQLSGTEAERGVPGQVTVQLVLEKGAEEYVLHPTVEDAKAILRFRDRSGRVYFDLQRKILVFGSMPVDAPCLAGLVLWWLE